MACHTTGWGYLSQVNTPPWAKLIAFVNAFPTQDTSLVESNRCLRHLGPIATPIVVGYSEELNATFLEIQDEPGLYQYILSGLS